MADLPCDADGLCMVCKIVPPDGDVLLCSSCCSPWHMRCLNPPLDTVPFGDWSCPDCSLPPPSFLPPVVDKPPVASEVTLVSRIHAIQADGSLTDDEKAKRRQELMGKGLHDDFRFKTETTNADMKNGDGKKRNATLEILDQSLNCIFCMQLAERPVTTPCGHNFCLKCFQRWVGQGKKTCGKCRAAIPGKMASQPRINAALVMAIRMARAAGNNTGGPPKIYQYRDNDSRPDKCFTTSRAVKTGKANACSGKIFVTTPPDHFGPITAEHDPTRGQGVLVGESWEDRMECRQWGAHLPHVAGIAGQSDHGSQSVALSGGYEDDEDHGEWFLYTGSGGRDLSGNKRTNKEQSFDQKFDKMNEALRVSCKQGYPVRVVRSHKEKRSSYAPEAGVRYDGVYRIEKCWRKKGVQGYRVCRYLFVRCDNEPAPWTSDEQGDRPRPLPVIPELDSASDVFERKLQPAWDFKGKGEWGWAREVPVSRKTIGGGPSESTQKRRQLSIQQRLLKEFGCNSCHKVLQQPLSMPCGHNFCKCCLEVVFAGQDVTRERKGVSGRTLRTQKVVKRCPTCKTDISDFLVSPQVNRQMEEVIQTLQNTASNERASETPEEPDEAEDDCRPGNESGADAEVMAQDSPESGVVQAVKAVEDSETNAIPAAAIELVENGDSNHKECTVTPSLAKVEDTLDKFDMIASSKPAEDPAFTALCKTFSEYSEDLLRSMLADQEGDVKELNALLNALHKQQKPSRSRVGRGRPKETSTEEVTLNGHGRNEKELMSSTDSEAPKKPQKRSRVDSDGEEKDPELNGHANGYRNSRAKGFSLKKLRANGVQLPLRASRSRACKDSSTAGPSNPDSYVSSVPVDVNSDSDFE